MMKESFRQKNRFFMLFFLVLHLEAWASPSDSPLHPIFQKEYLDLVSQKKKFLSLSSTKKGTVLVFLSLYCPCSNSYEPALQSLSQEFSQKGFQFFGIHSNFNEPTDQVRDHFKSFSFPLLQDLKGPDGEGMLANHLKALKTPHAYLLNTQGEILFKGGVGESRIFQQAKNQKNYLGHALLKLSQGLPLSASESEVRVLGCLIHRSEQHSGNQNQ